VSTETTITEDDGHGTAEGSGLQLLVMSPDMFVTHPLPASGVVTIGRSSKSGVQIGDPMASREHARLHVTPGEQVPLLTVEDTGSANGTHVRDAIIKAGEQVPLLPGEGFLIGSTVIMVTQSRAYTAPRRLWSHAFFEERLEEECARAGINKTAFALGRVRFAGAAPWTKVVPILARELLAPHIFGKYGPRDYEILFLDVDDAAVAALVRRLADSCRSAKLDARVGVAWYPRNGRNGDALLAAANALLNVPLERRGAPEVAAMERVRDMAKKVASAPINVLILGENGVGKDVLARLIHGLSSRAAKPFVALNCAALPETLMDSELFGHERGAFTGATSAKIGLLESANGGTLFLDEIGDMPVTMQAKLLRVIEAREVRPVGALKARPIDVRVVSATNKDLEGAAARSEFRLDLMHRLNGITLTIPPLRERTDEIPALVTTFVAAACCEMGRAETFSVGAEVLECLLRYHWPGNIRELKNVMERAVALSDGPEIQLEHLPLEKLGGFVGNLVTIRPPSSAADGATDELARKLPPLSDPMQAGERQRILDALIAHNWNQTRAAQSLQMPRRTFISKLDFFGLPRPQKGTPFDDVIATKTASHVVPPRADGTD
jgi:two-component system response regulator AtoC